MDANVIGSTTFYLQKVDGRSMARIVRWGHMDLAKNKLRRDPPYVNIEAFCLVVSNATEHAQPLGQMDIRTDLLQAKGFDREIYVSPPK